MAITEADALIVLPLSVMRDELRIPPVDPLRPTEGMEHDALITSQIVSAVSHVSRRTGATGDALLPLRPAAVAIVRAIYDGEEEVKATAAHNAWMRPLNRMSGDRPMTNMIRTKRRRTIRISLRETLCAE